MPKRLAGHEFNIFGICTLQQHNGSGCPVRWAWLRDQCFERPETMQKLGFAHVSTLNETEWNEIQQKVHDERKLCCAATYSAVGKTIVEEAPDTEDTSAWSI